MAPLDWITAAIIVYFAVSGLLSGAGALATTLSVFLTVASRSFYNYTAYALGFSAHLQSGRRSFLWSASIISSFISPVFYPGSSSFKSLTWRYLASGRHWQSYLRCGSVIVNGYAYLYLLNALLRSSCRVTSAHAILPRNSHF